MSGVIWQQWNRLYSALVGSLDLGPSSNCHHFIPSFLIFYISQCQLNMFEFEFECSGSIYLWIQFPLLKDLLDCATSLLCRFTERHSHTSKTLHHQRQAIWGDIWKLLGLWNLPPVCSGADLNIPPSSSRSGAPYIEGTIWYTLHQCTICLERKT